MAEFRILFSAISFSLLLLSDKPNSAEFGLSDSSNSEKDIALKSILNSANILSNIVNDILDFSKIEAGKLDIEHIDFNLKDVVNGVIEPWLNYTINNVFKVKVDMFNI